MKRSKTERVKQRKEGRKKERKRHTERERERERELKRGRGSNKLILFHIVSYVLLVFSYLIFSSPFSSCLDSFCRCGPRNNSFPLEA